MKPIRSILAKRALVRKVLDDKTVFFVFKKVIQKEFGNLGVENFSADYFGKGVLSVKSRSSAWASELWVNKERIIKKINQEFGEETVKKIKL